MDEGVAQESGVGTPCVSMIQYKWRRSPSCKSTNGPRCNPTVNDRWQEAEPGAVVDLQVFSSEDTMSLTMARSAPAISVLRTASSRDSPPTTRWMISLICGRYRARSGSGAPKASRTTCYFGSSVDRSTQRARRQDGYCCAHKRRAWRMHSPALPHREMTAVRSWSETAASWRKGDSCACLGPRKVADTLQAQAPAGR